MLEERIFRDYQEALKNKEVLKSSVLSFLRAEILNTAVAKKKDKLADDEIIAVVRKQIKSRQEAIEQFKKGSRLDLAEKESREIEILKLYLPAEMSQEELKKVIEEVISQVSAKDMKDMGRVMKEVNLRVGNRAEGRLISELVRQRLNSQ